MGSSPFYLHSPCSRINPNYPIQLNVPLDINQERDLPYPLHHKSENAVRVLYFGGNGLPSSGQRSAAYQQHLTSPTGSGPTLQNRAISDRQLLLTSLDQA